ncbi:hypothetical protein [Hydrogenimonas thermophila]|uniref:Uncharacterized protein n=1 Tax=Hydrogenimonas thermophila TaxID=223786 RepID=A0A1I5RQN1_9BACT|nr:hypothetical protein [Hydrogenimonas thermophila]SFP60717.1 hypothetical protein SAMN05216234_12818 [Hydrogenimonas thermophila]
MDIEKRVEELQTIHPFILLESEPNTPGEYLFFERVKNTTNPDFLDYIFKIYVVRNDLRLETLKEVEELLNSLLNLQYEYFEVIDSMKPIKLGDFFITYEITVRINENFSFEYLQETGQWS